MIGQRERTDFPEWLLHRSQDLLRWMLERGIIAPIEDATDFPRVADQIIWRAGQQLRAAGRSVDYLSVRAELEREGRLEDVGALYLHEMSRDSVRPSDAAIVSAAEEIKVEARNRRIRAMLARHVTAERIDPGQVAADLAALQADVSTRTGLDFYTLRELAQQVDAEGPRRWLIRGIWPAIDYGVHAAERKAQKTWNAADITVSVSSHTPWLGHFPIDDPGPVLLFVGEGGRANILRRIRAIAESRGLIADELPIVVCARAPYLNDAAHVQAIDGKIASLRPRLVIIDPLYLSAKGANLRDLYEMGAILETPQRICQTHGAALLIVTHFNRGQGQGAARITGAGPAEWGRVLMSSTVLSKHTDPTTKATRVLTEMEIIGGEIPDQTFRVHRHIWTDNPEDLNSPMHIETTVTEGTDAGTDAASPVADLPPAERKLLEALQAATEPAASATLVDHVAQHHGHGLKRETASRALNELERRGFVTSSDGGPFKPKLWALVSRDLEATESVDEITREKITRGNPNESPCDPCDITRDDHAAKRRVTSCDHTRRVVTHDHASGSEVEDAARF